VLCVLCVGGGGGGVRRVVVYKPFSQLPGVEGFTEL